MRAKSFSAVQAAEQDFHDAQESYLRERGWHYSSANVACVWMWEKALPDSSPTGARVVVVDRDMAVFLQSRADGISLKSWPKTTNRIDDTEKR